MARSKKQKSKVNENKVELAKTIAEKSEKIVRSYASIENTFTKMFRWISSWFDKVLFNQRYSKEVALILAIILYIATNSMDKLTVGRTYQSSTTFTNQPVTVEVNSSVYEVTGVPETVTLYLNGEMSDISMLTKDSQKVVADLSNLGEGVHQVKLKATNVSDRVNAVIDPSTVTVTIAKKTSKDFTIGYDFINTHKTDPIYALSEPTFERSEVLVRASQSTIDSISIVKALIDVSNITADFTIEAPLVAYDQNGNRVSVDIVPDKVVTSVKVSTPHKDVPINVIPIGEVPNDKAIKKYSLDHQTVTIYGTQDVLDQINKIDIQVVVRNFTQDTNVVTMPINLPSGVRKKSVSAVTIGFELADKVSKEVEDIAIEYKNNTKNYKLTIDENEPVSVAVSVSGAEEMVEAEDGSGIAVYIDLNEIIEGTTGTVELPLHVSGPNNLLEYKLSKETIKVNVAQ